MRCIWCSNPETILPKAQIGFYPAKCLSLEKCGYCLKVCPERAGGPLEFRDGILKAVRMSKTCDTCMRCVDECPPRAIKLWGELMTIDEMMKVIVEDRSFYRKTGGGVTLNGGEVLYQWEIAAMLLEECKKAGINTCIETALNVPAGHMEAVYRHTDLVITDIKHIDTEKHKKYTGAGNELILKNIKRSVALGKKLVIRTPVVPDYNSDEEHIRKIGAFIRDELENKIIQYQLLPYRRMGTEKYASLGIPYPMEDYVPPERSVWESNLQHLADMLVQDYGIPAVAGSSKKIEV